MNKLEYEQWKIGKAIWKLRVIALVTTVVFWWRYFLFRLAVLSLRLTMEGYYIRIFFRRLFWK